MTSKIMRYIYIPECCPLNSHLLTKHSFTMFTSPNTRNSDEDSYMGSLNRSLSLVLDEFYSTLRHVTLSAVTGVGMDSFFSALDDAAEEFEREYLPELQRRMERISKRKLRNQQQNLERVISDIARDSNSRDVNPSQATTCRSIPEEDETETHNV